jgi:hypothetical protein
MPFYKVEDKSNGHLLAAFDENRPDTPCAPPPFTRPSGFNANEWWKWIDTPSGTEEEPGTGDEAEDTDEDEGVNEDEVEDVNEDEVEDVDEDTDEDEDADDVDADDEDADDEDADDEDVDEDTDEDEDVDDDGPQNRAGDVPVVQEEPPFLTSRDSFHYDDAFWLEDDDEGELGEAETSPASMSGEYSEPPTNLPTQVVLHPHSGWTSCSESSEPESPVVRKRPRIRSRIGGRFRCQQLSAN